MSTVKVSAELIPSGGSEGESLFRASSSFWWRLANLDILVFSLYNSNLYFHLDMASLCVRLSSHGLLPCISVSEIYLYFLL